MDTGRQNREEGQVGSRRGSKHEPFVSGDASSPAVGAPVRSRGVPASALAVSIGARLNKARVEKGLTIEQVATASGLSKGFVSQLERGKASASVASLFRICESLGVRLSSLLDPAGGMLVRKDGREASNFGGEGVVDYLLTPPNERAIQLIETHIDPGGTAGEELWSAADVDCIYVLRGRLEVILADRTVMLKAGDAFTLSSREPHTWREPTKKQKAVVIFALAPAVF
jgi:transcriptional regulator with XRE-family HTH domain